MEGVQRAPRLATTGRRWEGGVLGKGMEAPTLSPISRPRHLFHLASPEFKYLVSLIPYSFKLLPKLWSPKQLCPSVIKFLHEPFNKNTWVSSSPPFHSATILSATILACFHSQKLWGSSCWHWNPGLRSSVRGWDPCSSGTTSIAEIPLSTFNHHERVWDQPVPPLHSSYQS